MKYFAAAFGESFRLFFKEIPLQWQPFIFIACVVIVIFFIISCSGLQIELPFLRINVNPPAEVRYIAANVPENVHPMIEHLENPEGRQESEPMRNNGNDIRRRILPNELENINAGEENCGIIEVYDSVEPRAVNNRSNLCSRPFSHPRDREINTTGSLPTGVQPILPMNDPLEGSSSNVLQSNPNTICRQASENQDTQEVKAGHITRNFPSESDYNSRQHTSSPTAEGILPLAEEEDLPSVSTAKTGTPMKLDADNFQQVVCSRIPLSGESSGSIVVPNPSSVFSMPLDSEQSIAEIPVTTEGVHVLNPRLNSSNGLPETIGSTEEGYLLVSK